MTRTTCFAIAVLVAASLPAAAGPDGAGGTPPANPPAATPPVTKDAETSQYLKDLAAQMPKQADADARTAIKKLVELWKSKDITDETKKPIPDLLEKYAHDEKRTAVAMDAIDGLGELGAAAGGAPVRAILERSLKAKDPVVDIYGSCLRSLKKLADTNKATVGALTDLLKHRMDDVIAKAADAMAGYEKAPGKLRRDMLEEIIKTTEGTSSKSKDPKNVNDVRKWQVIGGSVKAAMKALSGQQFADVAEARKWFNDHKKDKAWDS